MEIKNFQKNIQNKKNDREIAHNNESPKSVLQKRKEEDDWKDVHQNMQII